MRVPAVSFITALITTFFCICESKIRLTGPNQIPEDLLESYPLANERLLQHLDHVFADDVVALETFGPSFDDAAIDGLLDQREAVSEA